MSTYITLTDAKKHLRVDVDDTIDDDYIQDVIDMVEEFVIAELQGEAHHETTGTITTANDTVLTGIGTNFTDLKVGDVVKVLGDTSRIIATITSDTAGTVTVAFTGVLTTVDYKAYTGIPALKSDGTFPKQIRHAMLLLIGHFYMLREPVLIGVNTNKVPYSYEVLMSGYKNYTVT